MKNIGDDSFRSVFEQAFNGHELTFTHKPDPLAEVHILGGGGVVDFGYFDGLAGSKKPLYAVGVDIPLNGPRYDLLKRTPFRKILVRSKEYFWLAREQGLKNISYMPDLAFWFSPPERALASGKTKLGVSLTENLLEPNPHIQGHISRVLHRKKDLHDIVFLVFKPEDERVIEKVISLNPLPCEIVKPETPEQMLERVSELGLMLTMRFHGAVFANVCRVPFLGLSTPGKHSVFCEQEDLHDSFLDFRDVNEYKLLAALNRMSSFKMRGTPHKNHELVRRELALIRHEIERLV
jgi:polysaccharide pyruvyl transferase WcaK-like protein